MLSWTVAERRKPVFSNEKSGASCRAISAVHTSSPETVRWASCFGPVRQGPWGLLDRSSLCIADRTWDDWGGGVGQLGLGEATGKPLWHRCRKREPCGKQKNSRRQAFFCRKNLVKSDTRFFQFTAYKMPIVTKVKQPFGKKFILMPHKHRSACVTRKEAELLGQRKGGALCQNELWGKILQHRILSAHTPKWFFNKEMGGWEIHLGQGDD